MASCRLAIPTLLALGLVASAAAQTSADEPATIEEITVVGRYPGPPLWQVTSGERTLWIFGELMPVPKGLDWDPRNAERVLDRAGGVIGGPRVSAMTFNPIRMFRLYRAARRLARLPEGTTLADQMPAELYARYTALRARHLPKDDEDDEDCARPLPRCVSMAPRSTTPASRWTPTSARRLRARCAAREADEAEVLVETEPETVLEELAKITPEAEIACFASIMTSIETDLEGMKERANAWAIGDVEALKRFDYPDSQGNCLATLFSVGGLAELRDTVCAVALRGRTRARDVRHVVLRAADARPRRGRRLARAARGARLHGHGALAD